MAFGARHTSMGPIHVSDELGFHNTVAGLAAELDRLGVVITSIATDGGNEQEQHAAGNKEAKNAPVARPGQIDPERRKQSRRLDNLAMAEQSADGSNSQPDD